MAHPLVSIIIPFHNRFESVERALQSVLNQSWQDFEVILVDDLSKHEFKSNLLSDERVKLRRNRINLGPGGSRFVGYQMASGRYMAFLDSDDYWDSKFLETALGVIRKNPDCAFVYTRTLEISEGKEVGIRKQGHDRTENILPTILVNGRLWCTSSCLWHSEILDRVGGYPTGIIYEDYLLDLKASLITNQVVFIAQPLCYIDMGNEGKISSTLDARKLSHKLDSISDMVIMVHNHEFFKAPIVYFRLFNMYISTFAQLLSSNKEANLDRYFGTLLLFETFSNFEIFFLKKIYHNHPFFAIRYLRRRKRKIQKRLSRIPQELVEGI